MNIESQIGDSVLTKNDSSCYTINTDHFELKACHIIPSDSLNLRLAFLYGSDKIPPELNNVDFSNSNLHYSSSGKSIEIKILLFTAVRGMKVVPDTPFFHNDTMFINERGIRPKQLKALKAAVFEEFYYSILFKKNIPNLIIRHIKN